MFKMFNMFKTSIIASVTISMLLMLPVYAAENTETEEITHPEETLIQDETAFIVDESDALIGEVHEEDTGDGLESILVDVSSLPSSEENNCQLTVKADLPENFDANIYVQLQNNANGIIYEYTLYAVNNHAQRGYIPEGDYSMLECSVYGDINGAFPFNLAEDFSMRTGDVKTITVSLEDSEKAIDVISERYSQNDELNKNKKNTEYRFTTSDFYVTFIGAGSGRMAITGAQNAAMKVVARVTKAGTPGDMAIDVSLDDGMTYILNNVDVSYSGLVPLQGTGLTLVFELPRSDDTGSADGKFEQGDTFRSVIHDPKTGVNYSGRNRGRAKFELTDSDSDLSIYDQMVRFNIPKVVVKVIKGGAAGEAVVRYSLDGKTFSDEMIIPESARWQISNTTLSITFVAQAGEMYFDSGDTYIAEPYKESQIALYITLLVIAITFFAGAYAVWHYFKKQMIPREVYTIHEYRPAHNSKKS